MKVMGCLLLGFPVVCLSPALPFTGGNDTNARAVYHGGTEGAIMGVEREK